jgi:hypothetical protein
MSSRYSPEQAPIYQAKNTFIDFSSPYNSAISVIIIISGISFLLFIIYILRKKKFQYYSQEYWESRYSFYPQYIDWYCKFEKLCEDFQLERLFNDIFSNRKKAKILELGCGNSTLAINLKNLGFKNITSIDFSSIIINQMKQKFITEEINCKYKNLFSSCMWGL